MKKVLHPMAVVLSFILLLAACNSTKNVVGYNPTKKSYHKSPNISDRMASHVILHHTGCNYDTAYMLLATNYGKVSSHYLIDTDGTILQLVDEKKRGHHAGASSWFSMSDLNSATIGIEIVNNGSEPFPKVQIDSVMKVLEYLKDRYKFPARNFIGHMDIAPGRKVDPNKYFPWKRLAEAGYGIWYDEEKAMQMSQDTMVVASLRDPMINFMVLGYSIKKPAVTIEAFKLHFTEANGTGELSDYDKCVLQLLTDKIIEEAKE